MAGSRIKRINVEIGGDTTDLDKALKSVNSTIKTIQTLIYFSFLIRYLIVYTGINAQNILY